MSDVAVIHLVWAPLGVVELEGFLDSSQARPAGLDYRLLVIANGFTGRHDQRLASVRRALAGRDHELLLTSAPVLDLAAYRFGIDRLDSDAICFLNSYSRPLADDWLKKLAAPLAKPTIGMTGAGGSFESAYTAAPFWLRPRRRRQFDPFPNPHLRTNAFMARRNVLLELQWPDLTSKVATWSFESGRRSMSRQVSELGLELRVVGADGVAYEPSRWQESATFRAGGQRNLLIADNRTRQYDGASPTMKRRLEEMAWGSAEASGGAQRPAPA